MILGEATASSKYIVTRRGRPESILLGCKLLLIIPAYVRSGVDDGMRSCLLQEPPDTTYSNDVLLKVFLLNSGPVALGGEASPSNGVQHFDSY